MPGRGKGAGRKRKASEALQDRGDGERVHILEYHENEGTINEVFDDKPRKIRCGGDKLGSHVPESLKTKIKQNEYVNFSSLIKGPVELDMFDAGVTLGLDNSLNLVTRPRVQTDKISSIEKWSDAFLVFSSIYLSAHQEHTQDILHYMYVIREAASNFGGTFWRTYDEQFRLRQATEFMPWSSINSDLWLRCFSGAARTQSSSDNMPAKQNQSKPPCIDYNKGYCKWVNCRYPHICSICFTQQHGRWQCKANNDQSSNSSNSFRGSFRGPNHRSNWRSPSRGSFRGQRH